VLKWCGAIGVISGFCGSPSKPANLYLFCPSGKSLRRHQRAGGARGWSQLAPAATQRRGACGAGREYVRSRQKLSLATSPVVLLTHNVTQSPTFHAIAGHELDLDHSSQTRDVVVFDVVHLAFDRLKVSIDGVGKGSIQIMWSRKRARRRTLSQRIMCVTAVTGVFQLPLFAADRVAPDSPIESPRLRALGRALGAGNADGVTEFWREVEQSQTPLVEELPDHPKDALFTFLWRGEPGQDTLNVRLDGVFPMHSGKWNDTFQRLGETDIWFVSYTLPRDAWLI
jgi:hypothetical protein